MNNQVWKIRYDDSSVDMGIGLRLALKAVEAEETDGFTIEYRGREYAVTPCERE